MKPSLRKRHRIIWLLLAVVIPVLFVLAILYLPERVYQEQLFQETTDSVDPQELKIQ